MMLFVVTQYGHWWAVKTVTTVLQFARCAIATTQLAVHALVGQPDKVINSTAFACFWT